MDDMDDMDDMELFSIVTLIEWRLFDSCALAYFFL